MANVKLPRTMRALFQPDPLSTKLILATVPLPTPKADEHLIRVHTAAITNGELLWPKNYALSIPGKETTPLYDMAGTVVTAPNGSPFKPGDEVYARTDYKRTGSGREYTCVTAVELALRPKSLSWAETATVGMSAETAYQALFVQAGLKREARTGAKGTRIYITAASGSVGSWVVQLAKWAGAEVVASCSADSVERVKSLDADEVLDYRSVDVRAWASDPAKKVDLVIDCIGRQSLTDAWHAAKSNGTIISIYQPPEQQKPAELDVTGIKNFFFIQEALGENLKFVTNLWEEAGFVASLDSVWPLEEFEKAVERLESGKTKGKIVLDMGVQ
ncbi:hypothetical protein WAI453_012773 [Rhynchosporium graminicola]|uniref:Related to zinc-binding oxidoreductase n=1 Tax=Rhynchosporium graminicola TaxID=2792576 RepID=A0A1E1KQG0_9HELO|nr:related to zinc-binding oxidoreductase [Rhynchosporium commune]